MRGEKRVFVHQQAGSSITATISDPFPESATPPPLPPTAPITLIFLSASSRHLIPGLQLGGCLCGRSRCTAPPRGTLKENAATPEGKEPLLFARKHVRLPRMWLCDRSSDPTSPELLVLFTDGTLWPLFYSIPFFLATLLLKILSVVKKTTSLHVNLFVRRH